MGCCWCGQEVAQARGEAEAAAAAAAELEAALRASESKRQPPEVAAVGTQTAPQKAMREVRKFGPKFREI